ncbi:MAG: Holliday junction branch migration protein RuvA [Bdellovibrio sp.]|jgi:Holliday junction DNA helicase RuvA
MIGSLRGEIQDVSAEHVLIEVGGVGYECLASLGTLAELSVKRGQTLFLLTYTHVREDALQLFAFTDRAEKNLFLSLLKVNGIGPKMALNILSGDRVERILNLIDQGDAKALSKFPKVGKKTAEQMVLTLKGKLVLIETSLAPVPPGRNKELTSALVNLGFRLSDVEKVVEDLPKELDLQEGIRQGLAALTTM